MNFLFQLGLIFSFSFMGEVFIRFVPRGLPSPVMGMLFMLLALSLKLLKPSHIQESSGLLSSNMAFFFLPAMTAIILYSELIIPVLWQLLFIATFCSFFTFFAAYGATRFLRFLIDRKKP